MQSFLDEFYNCRIAPSEIPLDISFCDYPFEENINKIKAHFKENMSADDFKQLEILEHQHEGVHALEKQKLFEYAFSLGVLLMLDVLNVKESIKPVE